MESALDNWQNAWQSAAEISTANSTAEKLLSSLEQFNTVLEKFTGSLLFLQYEGTGLLPQESGKTARLMTEELTASVKSISLMESSGVSSLAAKTALAQKADTVRQELYSWSNMDSQISSKVFSRLIYIFGVFSFCVIGMIIIVAYRKTRSDRHR